MTALFCAALFGGDVRVELGEVEEVEEVGEAQEVREVGEVEEVAQVREGRL